MAVFILWKLCIFLASVLFHFRAIRIVDALLALPSPPSTHHHYMVATTTTTDSTTFVNFAEYNNNPLLLQNKEKDSLPKFSRIKPKHFKPAVEGLLEKIQYEFSRLETSLVVETTSYDNVLPELERIKHDLEYTWNILGHLNAVKNDQELREAYESIQPKVVQVMAQFSQSRPIYDALLVIEKQLNGTNNNNNNDDSSFLMNQKRRADLNVFGF